MQFFIIIFLLFFPCICSTKRDAVTDLREAIVSFNLEEIKAILQKNPHLKNMRELSDGDFIVQAATRKESNLEVVKKLLKAGINVQGANCKETPLHKIAGISCHSRRPYYDTSIAKVFLKYGACIEAKDYWGKTPLHSAAKANYLKMVKFLLKNGANIKAKDTLGKRPLHFAAEFGCIETANFFLKSKKSIEDKDNEGKTPLHLAAAQGYLKMVEILLAEGAGIEEKDNSGKTALHHAVNKNKDYLEMIKLLLKREANIKAKDTCGNTLLHFVVDTGKEKFSFCESPYDICRLNIVRFIIENGLSAEVQNNEGESALHLAVKYNMPEIVKLFIELKSNLEIQDNNGATPLQLAVIEHGIYKCKTIIEALLKGGAWLKAQSEVYKKSGHSQPCDPCYPKLYDILFMVFRERLFGVLGEKDKREIRNVLKQNPHDMMNVMTKPDGTLLHAAIYSKDPQAVEFLLACGADTEKKLFESMTPLRLAVLKKDIDSVRLLMKCKASLEPLNDHQKEYVERCLFEKTTSSTEEKSFLL